MNKKVLVLLVASLLCASSTLISFAAPYDNKLEKLELKLPDKTAQRQYENTLISRARYYKIRKDYQNSAIDLMSALYFMDDSTGRYRTFLKRLDNTMRLNNFEPTAQNKLDLAKALFVQKKYYASGWLFKSIAAEGYDKDVCYEYLGDIASIQNDTKKAQEYYSRSLGAYSKNPNLKLKLAIVSDKQGQATFAQEQYRQTLEMTDNKEIVDTIIGIYTKKIETDPNNANNYEILSNAYAKRGEYGKTYTLYKKAIELKPDDVFLKYTLASFLHELKEYNRAIEIYDSILNDDIYESQIRVGKAKCLEKLGRENEAIKEYQTVLIFYPESKQAQWGVYKLLKGKVTTENIFLSFYPLNDKFTPNAEFLVSFADFLAELGQINDAETIYTMALNKYPKNKIAYTHLFDFYELTGKSNLASPLIKKASTLFPNDSDVMKLHSIANKDVVSKKNSIAQSYIKNKEYERAIETYRQIVPQSAEVHFNIASCYKSMKNYSKAIESYKTGLQLEPKNFEGLYSLAMVYFDNNDLENARVYLNKALEVDPKNVGAKRILAVVSNKQVSVILDEAYETFEKRNYKKTHEILTAGIKKYPKDPQLYYYRALNFEAQKDYYSAIADLENSIKADKNFELSYYSLGQLFEATNKKKEALSAYEQFLSNNPQDPELIQRAQERVDALTKEFY